MVLFPRQQRFVLSPAPYPAYIGGIGSGKSFAGGAKVISRLGRKELGMIAAPTYPMLRDSTLEGFFRQLDDLGIPYEFHKGEYTITFPTGHKILCRSLEDPNKVRGPNLDYAWMDEAAFVTGEAWNILKGRVRVGSQPQLWITGTPKGRNWVWEAYERDGTGNEFDPIHPLFRVRTDENPELPAGFAASLGYTDEFAEQELGGEFVAFEGLVYKSFRRSVNVRAVPEAEDWPGVLGLDIGATNPTALLDIRYSDRRVHILREFYQRGLSTDDVTDAVVCQWNAGNYELVVVDPSSAGLILTLEQRGIRVRKAINDIVLGIMQVKSIIPTLTVDPSCVNLIAEYESYHYPEGRRGATDIPVKANDHAMDVVRYVCMELFGKPQPNWGMA
jgi:PBSX family phage terminase large subunit